MLIAPGFGTPAMPVKDPARLVPLIAYTNVYNVLDLPTGSLPVDVYTQDDQVCSPWKVHLYQLVMQVKH